MKVRIIIKLNQKGQIVILKEIRKSLGMGTDAFLNVIQRGQGIYLYPVRGVIDYPQGEESYSAILMRTKGAWKGDGSQGVSGEKKRRSIELQASKRRKQAW